MNMNKDDPDDPDDPDENNDSTDFENTNKDDLLNSDEQSSPVQ